MNAGRQLSFLVDATRCVNCKTCEIACQDFNRVPGVRLRRVRTFEHGSFPAVTAYNFSMSCNHCTEPLCVKYCPAGAYTKRAQDGIVVHDPDRCIGCRYCTWVCPYGAPQYDVAAGHVRKCNLCLDELDAGREPACVSACPLRAIELVSLDEIAARESATISSQDLPSPDCTGPACRYVLRQEGTHD
jgi:anaerobic dimethyl sulfoxide reductase subunit B (iron-sulfur subunit)